MPAPVNHGFPAQRPNFFQSINWIGNDDDLSLQVTFLDELGLTKVVSFPTTNTGGMGVICLPSSATIQNLGDAALTAHVRMAAFISHTVAGSKEFEQAWIEQAAADFQVAIGTARVVAVRLVSESLVELDWRKKNTNSPTRTLMTDHQSISKYQLIPEAQVHVVPGAVKLQFPNYVHDYPSQVLTVQQKADIVSHVQSLQLWI